MFIKDVMFMKGVYVYKDGEFIEEILQDLLETSNKTFQSLKSMGKIDEKQL